MAQDAPEDRSIDDRYVTVEIAWCAGCRLDTAVEVVQLPGDPAPVAICLECAGGVELWWQPVVPGHPVIASPPLRDARAS
jgi:hypothetical protein